MSLKVFISWGGPQGHVLSEALKKFLRGISPEIEPFTSPGVRSGALWREAVNANVLEADVGVAAITPEFTSRPWPMWETGGLYFLRSMRSKKTKRKSGPDEPRLFTILWRQEIDDLKDTPLDALQHRNATHKIQMRQFATDIAEMLSHRMTEREVEQRFEIAWQEFEETLNTSDVPAATVSNQLYITEMIEDIWVETQRERSRRVTLPALQRIEDAINAKREELAKPLDGSTGEQSTADTKPTTNKQQMQAEIDGLRGVIDKLSNIIEQERPIVERRDAIKAKRRRSIRK